MMKKPHAVKFWKKNDFYPFENAKNLEFLGFKNDTRYGGAYVIICPFKCAMWSGAKLSMLHFPRTH